MVAARVYGTRRWLWADEPREVRRADYRCAACGRWVTIRHDDHAVALLALYLGLVVGAWGAVAFTRLWAWSLTLLAGAAGLLYHASDRRTRAGRFPPLADDGPVPSALADPAVAERRQCACGGSAPAVAAWVHAHRGGTEQDYACDGCGARFTLHDAIALSPLGVLALGFGAVGAGLWYADLRVGAAACGVVAGALAWALASRLLRWVRHPLRSA